MGITISHIITDGFLILMYVLIILFAVIDFVIISERKFEVQGIFL